MRTSFSFVFLFGSSLILGCASSGSGSSSQRILGTIGPEPLTLQEFEETYAKNNGGWENAARSSLEDRERFLDLIVKFKLKILEARALGLDRDTAVQNEINSYRLSVANSYMLEKELVEPKIHEMYDRKKEEIRASHILFRLDPNASPKDTLEVYNKAMRIIQKVEHTGFDTLARAYSEDPSASFNKGDLGYFSFGRMVPEFEDACYSMQPGQYTRFPVRSQFGYHIIKVTDRRPNAGAVRLSHILRRFSQDRKDTAEVRDSVWAIYRQLKNGLSFAAAVERYSQDPESVPRQGDIGFYEREKIPPDLGNALFSLPIDSVLEPFEQPYGYHIFKVTGRKAIPSFQEMEKDLRQQYQQTRYKTDYQDYAHNLKKRYNLNYDVKLMYALTHSFDTTKTANVKTWSDTLPVPMLDQSLFTYSDKQLTVRDFVYHIEKADEFKALKLTPENIEGMIERITESQMLDEHASHVPERYPAFTQLMKEYENGILIYRIEQDEIWHKVAVNDSLLHLYYEEHKDKYRNPERVNISEIFVYSDSIAQALYKKIKKGEDFKKLADEFTQRPAMKEKHGEWGMLPVSHNEVTQKTSTMAVDSVSEPFQYEGGWSIIKIVAKDSARVKTFEETNGELTSVYQEQASKAREKEWIDALKQKYPVVLHRELLTEAFKGKSVDKF